MNLKKNRISKLCILVLIAIVSICSLDAKTAFSAENEQPKLMNEETGKERAAIDEAFHVMTDGGVDIYYPDKDPNFPHVVVPETVNGVTVTKISNDTFKDKGIKSIEIPDTVLEIGIQAFKGNSLERVKLPANLSAINGETFYGNKTLTSIDIPASVTVIGNNAFNGCGLTSIDIPDSVTKIGDHAFSKNDLTEVRLPSTLEELTSGIFSTNKKLKHIDIPDSVKTIENDAFRDCALESVKLPSQLSSIGKQAFMNNKIKSIIIPGTVTSWGDFAFANNALKSVVVEEGVTKIGSDFMNSPVFGDNIFNNISSVKLPSTTTSISFSTFEGSSLLYFDLPPSVTSLKSGCFEDQKVTMNYTIENNKSIVKLPKEMTISKFEVTTPGVTIDSSNYEVSIPKDIDKITYRYKLGTFSDGERFLTGTLTLGQGLIKVRFLDYDDSLLEEVEVIINETVTPSKIPTRDGYTFIGWDKSLENITESQDIKAQYKRLPELTTKDKVLKVGDTFDPLEDIKAMDADGNEIKDIKIIKNDVDTTKQGTYYVTLEVSDQWGGKVTKQYKVIVEDVYTDRILVDNKIGISVEGSFTKDAKVIVELTPVPVSSLNDKIKDKDLINAYEVHVVGEYRGKLNVKFPLDKESNGTKVYIYHEKNDGEIEEFEKTVNNGFVEITVDELSPFVLAKDIQKSDIKPEEPSQPDNKPNDSVQTGDYINVMIPIILLVAAGVIIISSRKNILKDKR